MPIKKVGRQSYKNPKFRRAQQLLPGGEILACHLGGGPHRHTPSATPSHTDQLICLSCLPFCYSTTTRQKEKDRFSVVTTKLCPMCTVHILTSFYILQVAFSRRKLTNWTNWARSLVLHSRTNRCKIQIMSNARMIVTCASLWNS